jgi:hypothetical protein
MKPLRNKVFGDIANNISIKGSRRQEWDAAPNARIA